MDELLRIKKIILTDSDEEYIIETKNKKTGWIGCASFHTNGEEKIHVNEGDPSGSDDKSYSYKYFVKNYDFTLKKETVKPKPSTYFNSFTLVGRLHSYYYDEENDQHVIMLSASNSFGDFTIPIKTVHKLDDKVLPILAEDSLAGIRGFIGLDKNGNPELYVEKFTILAKKGE